MQLAISFPPCNIYLAFLVEVYLWSSILKFIPITKDSVRQSFEAPSLQYPAYCSFLAIHWWGSRNRLGSADSDQLLIKPSAFHRWTTDWWRFSPSPSLKPDRSEPPYSEHRVACWRLMPGRGEITNRRWWTSGSCCWEGLRVRSGWWRSRSGLEGWWSSCEESRIEGGLRPRGSSVRIGYHTIGIWIPILRLDTYHSTSIAPVFPSWNQVS